MTISNYVTYFIGQNQRPAFSSGQNLPSSIIADIQKQMVDEYIRTSNISNKEPLAIFVEHPESKKTHKWPQLSKAIDTCKHHGATLIIAELSTLTNSESFTQQLLSSQVNFYCCDQPFVNQTNLEALSQYAQAQKQLHGKLIREGLQKTTAKSGNPNAAEVISKVNKPKIDTAIIFACLLQPIIGDYRKKGYSQRQMVKALNEEGFTAPEGGKWVLSQLQKVLDRVKLNEIAQQLTAMIQDFKNNELNEKQIADELNSRHILAIKRGNWEEDQVKRLLERIEQIEEISKINQFVLNLLPLLHEYQVKNFGAVEILRKFEKAGLPIKQEITTIAA